MIDDASQRFAPKDVYDFAADAVDLIREMRDQFDGWEQYDVAGLVRDANCFLGLIEPRRPDGPLVTLAEAVAILNERKHNGYARWRIGPDGINGFAGPLLFEFEAIAIAEKYQREGDRQHVNCETCDTVLTLGSDDCVWGNDDCCYCRGCMAAFDEARAREATP